MKAIQVAVPVLLLLHSGVLGAEPPVRIPTGEFRFAQLQGIAEFAPSAGLLAASIEDPAAEFVREHDLQRVLGDELRSERIPLATVETLPAAPQLYLGVQVKTATAGVVYSLTLEVDESTKAQRGSKQRVVGASVWTECTVGLALPEDLMRRLESETRVLVARFVGEYRQAQGLK
jgi:hypothetical protein